MDAPTVLFVPGLVEHPPHHWQTLLQNRVDKAHCVPRLRNNNNLSCNAWVEALDNLYARIEKPVVLAAHSAGCIVVAHWAQSFRRRVKGALLAVPPDFESALPEGHPCVESLASNGWTPIPREALPFPAILAASTNDPLASLDRVVELARQWGAELVNAGAVGSLDPESGFGDWPMGATLLEALGVPVRAAPLA